MLLVFLLATLNTLGTVNVLKRIRKLGLSVSSSYAIRLFKLCGSSPQVFLVSSNYAGCLFKLCTKSLQIMRPVCSDYACSLLFLCGSSPQIMHSSPLVVQIRSEPRCSVSSSCAVRLLLLCRPVSSSCAEVFNKFVESRELEEPDPY